MDLSGAAVLRENESGESGLESSSSRDHGSRSNRRYGTAAGTAAVERGDHAFVPRVLASNPTFPYSPSHILPGASIVLSLCMCSLVFLAWFGGSRPRGRQRQRQRGLGEGGGLSEKKGGRGERRERRLWREHSRIVGRSVWIPAHEGGRGEGRGVVVVEETARVGGGREGEDLDRGTVLVGCERCWCLDSTWKG